MAYHQRHVMYTPSGPPPPPPDHVGSNGAQQWQPKHTCLAVAMEVHGERVSGAVRRRRQRRLRQWHRHERLAVQMALANAANQSAQPKRYGDRGRRGQERWRSRIPRRRGVLGSTVASAMSSWTDGGTAGGRFCAAFLEEAEANDLEAEYMELVRSGFSKSLASLERMREVVRRRKVLHQKGRGRKKRKRKKRKLPKGSSPRSLPARAVRTRKSGHLSCGSCWCSVSGCCLTSPGLLGLLGHDFFDVSVLYAQLGPILDTRTCVSLRDIWVGFPQPIVSGSRLFDAVCA